MHTHLVQGYNLIFLSKYEQRRTLELIPILLVADYP